MDVTSSVGAFVRRSWLRFGVESSEPRRAGASPFARDVMATLGARIGATGLGFLTAAVGARILGPVGWGVYAVALALTSIVAQLGNLGLHSANTYHVSQQKDLAPALVANSVMVSLGVGALAALLATATAAWPGLFRVSGRVLALALGGVPLLLGGIFLRAVLLGLGDVRAYNVAEVLAPAAALLAMAALAVAGAATPTTAVGAGIGGLAVVVAYCLAILTRQLHVPARPSLALLRTTLHFGLRAYVAAFFSFALLRVDLLMVNAQAGPREAGLYSAAVSLADALYLLPTVVGALLFPRLVRLPPNQRWQVTTRLTWRLFVLLAVVAAPALIAARRALIVAYGLSFADATPALRILAVATVFIGANTVVSNHLAAIGFPVAALAIWAVAAASNVALNVILIPEYGIAGAAFASLVCYAAVFAAQYSYARSRAVRDA